MLETILSHLDGVRRQGRGYVSRCPAHADKSPSLSLREGDDGRILIHCHAGCTAAEVMGAIGMTLSDLFPGSGNSRRPLPAPGVSYSDLRKATELERSILFIVNADRARGKLVSAADTARAQIARQRLEAARRHGC